MPEDSDFLELAQGMMGMAENLYTYYQSCVSANFDEEQALMLTLNLQESLFHNWTEEGRRGIIRKALRWLW